MGKKSTKKDKNIYQLCRENLELTRDKASELLGCISSDRIEKIESGKSAPHPDEVILMSDGYKNPHLCNHYCSHECPIGREYVPEVKMKDLSQITLSMLASLNAIDKQKNRLIEITADGEITENEYEDFARIQTDLENVSLAVESLQLWIEQMIDNNKIDREKLDSYRETKDS